MLEREMRMTLYKHVMYCQEQLQKAKEVYEKYGGFYSQQYESIQEHKECGLDFMQWNSLKRKAKSDVVFWDNEFGIAVNDFYSRFKSNDEANVFMLMCY